MAGNRMKKDALTLRAEPLRSHMRGSRSQLLALVLLVLFFSGLTRQFFSLSNLTNILRQISTKAMLAYGMTIVVVTGGIDLSVGSVVALSSCLAASLLNRGCPIVFAVPAAILSGCLFGYVNGSIVTLTRIPAFITTMSTATIGRGIASLYTNGKSIMVDDPAFIEIGNGHLGAMPNLIVYLAVFSLLCGLLLDRTRFGRLVYAIGDNRETARFVGIRIDRVERLAYTCSGTLSGAVGVILAARMYSGQPLIGEGRELDAIAAVVIGGTSLSGGSGTILGTLTGAMILGVMNNGLNLLKVQTYWQQIFKGALIIGAASLDLSRNRR